MRVRKKAGKLLGGNTLDVRCWCLRLGSVRRGSEKWDLKEEVLSLDVRLNTGCERKRNH